MNSNEQTALNDEHLNIICNKIDQIFGERAANPEQEPIRFNHQIKVALFLLGWKIKKE